MNNVRLLLWLALFSMAWLTYSAWVTDYAPVPQAAPEQSSGVPPLDTPRPRSPADEPPQITDGPSRPQGDPISVEPVEPEQLVHVRTDVLDLWIDLDGGDIVRADLLEYPVDKQDPDRLVRLLDYAPDNLWVFQTGLTAGSAEGGAEPNHQARFTAASNDFTLAGGRDSLTVELTWAAPSGLSASKIYTFRRGSYEIDLALSLENDTATPWRGAPYARMVRLHRPPGRSYTSVDSYSFTGPVLYDGELDKLDVEDLVTDRIEQTLAGGWYAAIQHHFLAAVVPPADDEVRYEAVAAGEEFVLSAVAPVVEVPAAGMFDYVFELFIGPKLQDQLEATANELELTVDYGMLTILAKPLFSLLSWVESWVGNWGWAIIIVTFLIKLAFYKLTATSGKSMAKMRELGPRMKALQERYKDDRQALSQAMMDLYKREKVNPAAGCLPILIQMPFFFAFYWVLVESVEMRQAPFMLWIDDLSSRDPFFVLPLLMGAAMFFQTRLNPAPPDPVQARVMQIMPIVFTAFFMLFPAGLVLYWLTNTVLSIAQQWRINKLVAAKKVAA